MTTKRILCIDDDLSLLKVLETRLGIGGGFDVITADSAEAGLKLARKRKPDAILLDWSMPGLSGLEALKLLKSDGKVTWIPIFMLTGRTKMEDVETALDDGALGYFTKPVNYDLIITRLRRTLETRAG